MINRDLTSNRGYTVYPNQVVFNYGNDIALIMLNEIPQLMEDIKTMTDLDNAINTLKVDADKLTADINAAEAAQNAQADAATPAVVTETAAV